MRPRPTTGRRCMPLGHARYRPRRVGRSQVGAPRRPTRRCHTAAREAEQGVEDLAAPVTRRAHARTSQGSPARRREPNGISRSARPVTGLQPRRTARVPARWLTGVAGGRWLRRRRPRPAATTATRQAWGSGTPPRGLMHEPAIPPRRRGAVTAVPRGLSSPGASRGHRRDECQPPGSSIGCSFQSPAVRRLAPHPASSLRGQTRICLGKYVKRCPPVPLGVCRPACGRARTQEPRSPTRTLYRSFALPRYADSRPHGGHPRGQTSACVACPRPPHDTPEPRASGGRRPRGGVASLDAARPGPSPRSPPGSARPTPTGADRPTPVMRGHGLRVDRRHADISLVDMSLTRLVCSTSELCPGVGPLVDLPERSAADQGVDLRRGHAGVAEELLNDPHVGPAVQQMRREGVAERVR